MDKKETKKLMIEAAVFLLIMLLTWKAVFSGQDLGEVMAALEEMSVPALVAAMLLSVFFVSAEGYMIWYLLKGLGEKNGLLRCIGYSFVGFFFSGITPSATGGQPMQLYCMNKDGNAMSNSSVVLMTVAVAYKTVLVTIGLGILLFCYRPLRELLGAYFWLYLLGLSLNVIVVAILFLVMFTPSVIRAILLGGEKLLVKCRMMKKDDTRQQRMDIFIDEYQQALDFFKKNKEKLFWVLVVTFLQRSSLFILTYVVYLGLGLSGSSAAEVILLQASVYVAVDMLPIPGAQGITEMMYSAVFLPIFTGSYLMPSMLITRGINFYFPLVLSLGITMIRLARYKRVKCMA